MPGGDGTGPVGMGPMTGREAGYCAGYPTPGFMSPAGGRGFGGRGRGRRNRFRAGGAPGWQRAAGGWPAFGAGAGYATPHAPPTASPEQELDALKHQSEALASALDNINNRIAELEASPRKE
jgi:hypothetical protein